MKTPKPHFIRKAEAESMRLNTDAARKISQDPTIIASSVGHIATEWAEILGRQDVQTLHDQLSATSSFSHMLTPEGFTPEATSPMAILRGDFGPEASRIFLDGALMALEHVAATRLESLDSQE